MTRRPQPAGAAGSRITVKVSRLPHGSSLPLPAYQTPGSAGLDLLAAIDIAEPLFLAPGVRSAVPTGLALELPAGSEAQVRPRSGLALKQGITLLNSPGTIDCDYRGEVLVILINLGLETATIRRGDRIAQLVIAPVTHANLVEVKELSGTERGASGFGSTGIAAIADKTREPKEQKKKTTVPPKASSGAKNSAAAHRNKPRRAP